MMFSSFDLRWLSRMILDLHACTTEDDLHERLLPAVHHRFRAGVSQIEEVAFDLSTYRRPVMLGGRALPDGYLAALPDSPVVTHGYSTGWPCETLHLTQLASRGALHGTNFFNVVLRHLELGDQLMGIIHGSPAALWEFGVNRDVAFTERERALFDLLRRHVEAVLHRIRRSGGGLAPLPVPEIRLGSDLRPHALPPALGSLLECYFPADRSRITSGGLPDAIRCWIQDSLQILARRPPPHPLTFLRTESARGWLVVRLFPEQAGGDLLLRLTEQLRHPNPLTWRSHGLTTRECEVLYWIREGKSDGEVALILGCSVRTVEKHVAHVLRKAGASNRQSAVYASNQWQRIDPV